jgi:predicted porin
MKKFMKMAAVAASMTALSASAADAIDQTKVNFFGVFDAGVVSANALGTQGDQSQLIIDNGVVSSSFVGITAKTNIGSGQTIGIKLESNLSLNDGSQVNLAPTGTSNVLFSREASISHQSDLGTFTFGRQKTPFAQSFALGDARGWANIGTAVVMFGDSSAFGGSATLKTGLGTLHGGSFTSSMLKYETPVWNGLSAIAYYAPGGYSGNFYTATSQGTNLKYVWNGLTLGAATRSAYDKTVAAPKIAQADALSASYTLGKWKFGTGVAEFENPATSGAGTANSSFRISELTTAYAVNKQLTVSLGQYVLTDRISDKNGTTLTGTGAIYQLSKSTSLYAQYANSNNKGTMGIAAYGGGFANLNSLAAGQATYPSVISRAGVDQTAVAFGITHRF